MRPGRPPARRPRLPRRSSGRWLPGDSPARRTRGNSSSFNYRDITAFEVNTGWTTGVVEILASGYLGGKEKDYWASDKDRDPFKMSNCVPIPKKAAAQWQPYLQWIRERIEEAHRPHPTPEPQAGAQQDDTGDVVAALERLQALKGAGALSDTEFELAKQKVLGAASGNFDSQSPTPAAQEDWPGPPPPR